MLFSSIFYPAVAILSVTSSIFASPVAQPKPAVVEARDVEARQLDSVLAIVQGLATNLTPLTASLTNAGLTNSDPTSILTEIQGLFNGATSSLGGLPTPVGGVGNPTQIVSLVISIIVSLISALTSFSLLSILPTLLVDTFLSTFLGTLGGLIPGLPGSVGSGLPLSILGALPLLGLLNTITTLGLGGLLGGLGGL